MTGRLLLWLLLLCFAALPVFGQATRRVAESSLTTLKGLYGEQSVLVTSLRVWADQPRERLSVSDQSLVWVTEDVEMLEASLSRERAYNARLDRSARVWQTVAVVAGVIALGVGIAVLVW
jgi:hypothetical protein